MDVLSVPSERLSGHIGVRPRAVARTNPGFTLLHRQVLSEVLQVFLVALAAATGLMIVVGVLQQLMSMGATAELLLELCPYFVPVMLPFVIPSALLFSVIIVYGRMGADSEFTAVKAAGVNALSLLTPSILLGAGLAVTTFFLTDRAVPWAARQIHGAVIEYASDLIVQQLASTGHIENGPGGMQITVAGMDGSRMIRPMIRCRVAGGRECSILAEAAQFEIDRALAAVLLHVEDATVYAFRESPGAPDQAHIRGEQTFRLDYAYSDTLTKSHHLPLTELRRRIRDQEQRIERRTAELSRTPDGAAATEAITNDWTLHEAQRTRRNLRTEMHSRYALAYGSFGFAFFGSALAALQASSRLLFNIFCCFMPIVGAYYVLELGIAAQCKSGHLDPAWSMWIGNVLLTGLGLHLLRIVTRR